MSVHTIFATGIIKSDYPELASEVSSLFVEKNLHESANANFKTSLETYIGYGGTQVRENYNKKELTIVDKIKTTILKESEKFFEEFGYKYDKTDLELTVTGLWLNEMESNSQHEQHQHYGNILSGCFYVDVPQGSGGITFIGPLSRFDKAMLDIANYTIFNSHSWTLDLEKGNLLLWESYIPHRVVNAEFIGKRRSIAFDVSLKPIKKGVYK